MICPATKKNISPEYEPRYCSHTPTFCACCDMKDIVTGDPLSPPDPLSPRDPLNPPDPLNSR
ncbi:Uncharacterised protein [uncultured archaeon]|nr:Uncharacterised protein [uncultured archaeon]